MATSRADVILWWAAKPWAVQAGRGEPAGAACRWPQQGMLFPSWSCTQSWHLQGREAPRGWHALPGAPGTSPPGLHPGSPFSAGLPGGCVAVSFREPRWLSHLGQVHPAPLCPPQHLPPRGRLHSCLGLARGSAPDSGAALPAWTVWAEALASRLLARWWQGRNLASPRASFCPPQSPAPHVLFF